MASDSALADAAPTDATPVRVGIAGTWIFDDFDDLGKDKPIYPDLDDAPGSCGWLYGGPERVPVPTAPEDWPAFYRQFFAALRSADPCGNVPVAPTDVVHIAEILDAAILSGSRGQVVRLGE